MKSVLTRHTKFVATFLALVLAIPGMVWSDGSFTEDVKAAIESAKKENKDLFVLFTGSDWCPPCKKLDEEVFSKSEFLEPASKNFVLLKLDFPQNREVPPEIAKQNEEWSGKYGISGFPTVAILDVNLRPVGFMGFMEGGPGPYLEALMALKEKRVRRDEALAKLPEAKTDDERALILDAALSQLDEEIINVYYTEERDRIVAIDDDNHLQLRAKYNEQQDAEMRKMILADIMSISQLEKPEKAVAFIDEVLEKIPLPVENRFEILQIKLGLLQKANQHESGDKLLDEMLAMEGVGAETRERLLVKKVLQYITAKKVDLADALIEENLKQPGEHLLLTLTKGQILANTGELQKAVETFDKAIPKARFRPDAMIELVGAKADALVKLKQEEAALAALDNFADDSQMPTDLRCESLLHQAMIMRMMGRTRPAMLTENRAVELADTPQLKREIQNVIEKLRARAAKE
ncbi:MAG: thioredoxin family protein [Pirellulaceae bacterium]